MGPVVASPSEVAYLIFRVRHGRPVRMPRFHLHVYNSTGYTCDEEGVDLSGLDEAKAQAVCGIRSILREEILGGSVDLRGRIEIADGGSAVLAVVRFAEAVEVHLDREGP